MIGDYVNGQTIEVGDVVITEDLEVLVCVEKFYPRVDTTFYGTKKGFPRNVAYTAIERVLSRAKYPEYYL